MSARVSDGAFSPNVFSLAFRFRPDRSLTEPVRRTGPPWKFPEYENLNDNAENDPRLHAIPDIHGHAKGEHKAFTDERPIPLSARMLFLWFFHACRRGWPRFMMVTDHMNYLTFEDPAAINLVRRALKLAQAGDLYGAAETASVEVGHAAVVSEGLRRGMHYSIGAEVDNDPRSRPDAQNIVDAMKPDGMIRSVHFLTIDHPSHGPNWNWPFDNPEFADVFEIVGTAKTWELYMATLLDAVDRLPGNILGHFYVPAVFGHWPDDATLSAYEDRIVDACEARGMAIEVNTRFLYRDHPQAEKEKYLAAYRRLLLKCKAKNVGIAVGSDAHSPKDQGRAFDIVLALLDECEINELVFPIAGRLARVALRVERKPEAVAASETAPVAADERKAVRKPRTSDAPARQKDASPRREDSADIDDAAPPSDDTSPKSKARPKRGKGRPTESAPTDSAPTDSAPTDSAPTGAVSELGESGADTPPTDVPAAGLPSQLPDTARFNGERKHAAPISTPPPAPVTDAPGPETGELVAPAQAVEPAAVEPAAVEPAAVEPAAVEPADDEAAPSLPVASAPVPGRTAGPDVESPDRQPSRAAATAASGAIGSDTPVEAVAAPARSIASRAVRKARPKPVPAAKSKSGAPTAKAKPSAVKAKSQAKKTAKAAPKALAKKSAAKKSVAKKSPAKKVAPKKPVAKKPAPKKIAARATAAKKATGKKAPGKKTGAKKPAPKRR